MARFAQPTTGSTFYMFNSAAWEEGDVPPYPVEIIATDAAEKGELFRYRVPGGSLYGALDDSGALWLRVGSRLVKVAIEKERLGLGGRWGSHLCCRMRQLLLLLQMAVQL